MKVLLDTNILVSNVIYGGNPRLIFQSIVIDQTIKGVTSEYILSELKRILKDEFEKDNRFIQRNESTIRNRFEVVTPKEIIQILTNDLSDNHILAAAKESQSDYIISGDKHLLNLKFYQNIPIVTASKFLDFPLK